MKLMIINFFKGILVGIANIIPGVSGGTIAVVLGIFDELIDAINNFHKEFKKHFIFLVPIGVGAVVGIIAFSSFIEYSLETHSFETSMFFVGLVVGSIPLIYSKARERTFKPMYVVATIIATAIVIAISLLKGPSSTASTNFSIALIVKMFFCGALASAAMITPGISGSFIMVLLGIYPVVIHAVSELKTYILAPTNFELLSSILVILVPIGLGIILGIVLISKLIAFLLKKAHAITYFSILGLILGSIFGIFNDPITYQSGVSTTSIGIGIGTLVIGIAISTLLGKE